MKRAVWLLYLLAAGLLVLALVDIAQGEAATDILTVMMALGAGAALLSADRLSKRGKS